MGFSGVIAGIDHEEQIKKKRERELDDKQKDQNKKDSEQQ